MKKSLIIFIFPVLVGACWLFNTGCANIIPPTGGPRDSIPPVLLKVSPADSTLHFEGNRISFDFDEYIVIDNPQDLLVTPIPRTSPIVEPKLRTITVKLKDTLEPNTTYTLNFGNIIRDNNEGNALKNFTYVFSTGSYLDSLQLGGKVVLANNGLIDTTLVVMLHRNGNDSALINEKPRYVTKLDSKGNFLFRNLPPGTFYVYALKDEGGTYRYFGKQLFAFRDSAVTVSPQSTRITLYAYGQPAANQPSNLPSIPGLTNRNRRNEAADKRLRYQLNLVDKQQDLLTAFVMSFDEPLRTFDSTRLRLSVDSAYNTAPAYHFSLDSTRRKVTLTTEWKEKTGYNLILDKDFAEDSTGHKLLKTDTLHFTTKRLSEYGSLKLRIRNLDLSKNPVLQFILNDNVVKSVPLTGDTYQEAIFLPGDYQLRILEDRNRNGVWDPGDFYGRHLQPEIVRPIDRRITVRPAWQNEVELSL